MRKIKRLEKTRRKVVFSVTDPNSGFDVQKFGYTNRDLVKKKAVQYMRGYPNG